MVSLVPVIVGRLSCGLIFLDLFVIIPDLGHQAVYLVYLSGHLIV